MDGGGAGVQASLGELLTQRHDAVHYEWRIDRHDFVLLAPPDGDGPNVSLEARRSDGQVPPRILADPEDNRFCVIDASHEFRP